MHFQFKAKFKKLIMMCVGEGGEVSIIFYCFLYAVKKEEYLLFTAIGSLFVKIYIISVTWEGLVIFMRN